MKIRPAIKKITRNTHEEDSQPVKGDILDCAVGGNLFGISPDLIDFANNYKWTNLSRYPDTGYTALKNELCKYWSDYARLEKKNIKIACGSCDILSRLNRLIIEKGVKTLGYVPQFKDYMEEVFILDGTYDAVPLNPSQKFKFNVEELLKKISGEYAIVYLDNPNNPTGQIIPSEAIEAILKEAKKYDALVIVDEAFGDYVKDEFSAVGLLNKYNNLAVTRTFTKGYGLAQMRVGYAFMSAELSDYYSKAELPFPISTLAELVAVQALKNREFLPNLQQKIKTAKSELTAGLKKKGYSIAETHESCPIFLMGSKDSDDLASNLLEKGIRTTPGTEYENLGKKYVRINTTPRVKDFLERV